MIFNLSHLGLIKISGLEAKKMLQGQLTCNVEEVTPHHALTGAHCNPQGRIIGLFLLSLFQDDYYMLMPRSMISIAMTALKKYAVFYKVELTDVSDHFMLLGIQEQMAAVPKEVAAIILPYDSTRVILFGKIQDIKKMETKRDQPPPKNSHSWKYLDIKAGFPQIYPETTGKLLPHEINLDVLSAISFEKGCYTGQEIIARMHYRGKLKKRMYHAMISFDEVLAPGMDVFTCDQAGKIATQGVVVDAAIEKNHAQHVLLVTDENNAKNNHLFVMNKEQKVFFNFDVSQ